MTQYPFNSIILCKLLYCSLLDFDKSLRHALGRFGFEFLKNRMGDKVIVKSFKGFD